MTECSSKRIKEVLELDKIRLSKGYKPGWLYYKCKEKGLQKEFKLLRSSGAIEGPLKKEHAKGTGKLLTIELVPETCWFSNVRSNVSAEEWKRLRTENSKLAGYRCEICNGQGPKWPVECHEKWEYEDDNKIQRLVGLISLCPSCHEVKHMGLAGIKGRRSEAIAHLAAVNNWSDQETHEYVEEQFRVWKERSKHAWTLDITWLESKGIMVEFLDREEPTMVEKFDDCRDDYQHRSVRSGDRADIVLALKIGMALGLIALLVRVFIFRI